MSLILQDVLFDVKTNKPVKIDLAEIIKSRALFQANSGGGKSYILRKFLEQSHGKVQQIIIDPEGEFATLREKYDYLLVSKSDDANIQLNINHAGLLARRLLETGANAILDLYELNPFERIAYVKAFCDALINLPKNLWHSCLVIIDEIHTFAPENSKGNAGSLEAVAALASRGRKRGYALIGATQKLSKFHKDVAAELNTKFTGRCILDIDQKRASAELGLSDYKSLRNLKYEFWAFGPAISGEPILVKSYEVETKHEDIGNTKITTIADQNKLNKLMEQFKDLPTEAANELKTKEDLQNKIKELTVRLMQAQKQPSLAVSSSPKIDPLALQKAEQAGQTKAWKEAQKQVLQMKIDAERYIKFLQNQSESIKSNILSIKVKLEAENTLPIPSFDLKLPTETKLPIENSAKNIVYSSLADKYKTPTVITKGEVIHPLNTSKSNQVIETLSTENLSKADIKVLTAIVQRQDHKGSRTQIAVMSEYSPTSGSFRNILGKLRSSGFIQYSGDDLIATESGIASIGDYQPLPTDPPIILQKWLSKLPGPEQKILSLLCEAYPETVTREDMGEKTGYSPTSGSFRNSLGHLRSTGLIEYIGTTELKASKEMFPE